MLPLEWLVVFLFLFCSFKCDIEYVLNDTDLNQPNEFTKQQPESFDRICLDDSRFFWNFMREKLELVADKNTIEERELRDYLRALIKRLNHEDLIVEINALDKNKTGHIQFRDYIFYTFELDADLFEKSRALSTSQRPANPIDQDNENKIEALYSMEKFKWNLLTNDEPTIDYESFYKFRYSYEFPDLQDKELNRMFELFDTNKNGNLDAKELSYLIQEDSDQQKNKLAGIKLSLSDFKKWYLESIDPSLDAIIGDELKAIYDCCDDDGDRMLTEAELVKHCSTLARSKLTNYGYDINLSHNQSDTNPEFLKDEL